MSTSDVSDWEVEEGLPQFSDPFLQQYLSGRSALIDQEKSTRSDASFRASLTPLALEACAIVSRIRAEERHTVWNDHAAMNGHVFPGMPFTLVKERLEETKLWEILSRMPKGALLHAHFDAMIDVEWLIDQALATKGMGFWVGQKLAFQPESGSEMQELQKVPIGFRHVGDASQEAEAAPSIWSPDYVPKTCVSVTNAADSYPFDGRSGFKRWLTQRCTITASEAIDPKIGLDAVWQKFGSCFPIIGSILHYEPIFRAAIPRLLAQLLEDGIRWVDLRAAFVFDYYREGHTAPEDGYEAFFRAFGEELAKFQASPEGARFWGARFIWTTLRRHSKQQVVTNMKLCIATKQAFPTLISGFDLVGQEDLGRSLVDLTPELFWFRKRCVEAGVELPFFFHAGECLGDGDETDENLFDAILLGTRRLGHAFSLHKHPLLVEMAMQKSILVESCPISNEILRLTHSIMAHPLPALLARGVKIALCNDDPAILGHGKNGLTHDFWQALQGWENLGLEGLGSLAENSVRWAAYGPDQATKEWVKDVKDGVYGQGVRAERMREWTGEWNAFCEWVVREFAADYGSDGEGDDIERGEIEGEEVEENEIQGEEIGEEK
ncbi:hypothetical protein MMC13_002588 [Lambiella insularis]|nr:hypothetical protein [Lambiella insularis]